MAFEYEQDALESALTPEDSGSGTPAADYLISARALSRKMVDRGRRQAEEILRDANTRADAIVARAQQQTEEILAAAKEEAERLRAESVRETKPVPSVDQDHAVRCVEACFEQMRQQHLDAIEALNTQWQAFLCGLYTEEEPEAEEAGEVPADLADRVSAIAEAMEGLDGKK